MAEEAKWYVVHTYSGYENKVKVDIEKTIENRNLQDQILEVMVPMQTVVEERNGAVSYTHLDVYKRQPGKMSESEERFLYGAFVGKENIRQCLLWM